MIGFREKKHQSVCLMLLAFVVLTTRCEAQQDPKAEATSVLKSERQSFSVSNLFDRSFKSWCEGVPGPGVGEGLKFNLRRPADHFYLKNGFGILGYYKANGRVREIEIYASGRKSTQVLRDSPFFQKVDLRREVEGEVRIVVRSVYSGDRFKDTCLAEISLENPNKGDFAFKEEEWKVNERSQLPDYLNYYSVLLSVPEGLAAEGEPIALKPNGRVELPMHGQQCPVEVGGKWSISGPNLRIDYVVERPACSQELSGKEAGKFSGSFDIDLTDCVLSGVESTCQKKMSGKMIPLTFQRSDY